MASLDYDAVLRSKHWSALPHEQLQSLAVHQRETLAEARVLSTIGQQCKRTLSTELQYNKACLITMQRAAVTMQRFARGFVARRRAEPSFLRRNTAEMQRIS